MNLAAETAAGSSALVWVDAAGGLSGSDGRLAGSAHRAPRLDEPHLARPRHRKASYQPAPVVGDRIHELDALAFKLLNGSLDVVAGEIELVLAFCRAWIAPRMNRELRRRHESQPALGGVGTWKFQDVAEEGRRRLGIMRENSDDRRSDHLPSVRFVTPQSKDATRRGFPRCRCTSTYAATRSHGRKLAPAQFVEEEHTRLGALQGRPWSTGCPAEPLFLCAGFDSRAQEEQ